MKAIRIRSCRVVSVRVSPNITDTGRMTSTSRATKIKPVGRMSPIWDGVTRPASMMNSTPTSSTCRCSLNSMTGSSSRLRWFAR